MPKGKGGSVDDVSVTEMIQGLRSLLDAIAEGRVEATAVQRAYVRWTRWWLSQNVRIETSRLVTMKAGVSTAR